jgi:cytochrome c oxidase subunit 2
MHDDRLRRLRGRVIAAATAAAATSACHGAQAVLAPQGPRAEAIADLAWLVFAGGAAIFLAVLAAILLAVRGPEGARRVLAPERTVLAAGVVFPVVTLSALLVHGLRIESRLFEGAGPALAIEVVGEQWWWRVRYLDESGRRRFETANEIRIPVGRPVEFRLSSADVIHSFWVPNLAGKLDMIPGRENRLRVQADRPGVFRGQCAEFCGGAHALMAFHVVAEEPGAFEAWHARQEQPAREPATAEATRGRELFLASGCGLCHRVAGTGAAGRFGPDLTHVGGRLHVVSGMLPNHRGALQGWIAAAQQIKPENLMPSYTTIPGADLQALGAWLESLE